MSVILAGLDCGKTGALAWLGDTPGYTCLDTCSPGDVSEALMALRSLGDVRLTIERCHTMPKMGVASSFRFGGSFWGPQFAAQALGIPVRIVTAQAWRAWALKARGVPQERPERERLTVEAARGRWPLLDLPKSKVDRQAVACALFLAAYPQENTHV